MTGEDLYENGDMQTSKTIDKVNLCHCMYNTVEKVKENV